MWLFPFVVSPSFDFAQDIREKPFALRLSKGRTVCSGQALSNHERTYNTVSYRMEKKSYPVQYHFFRDGSRGVERFRVFRLRLR
jgi:hypothetical protein